MPVLYMAGIFPNRLYQYWQYKRDKYKKNPNISKDIQTLIVPVNVHWLLINIVVIPLIEIFVRYILK